MPTYEYKCEKCDYYFEEFLQIKDRKKPEKKNCKNCGEKKIKQVCMTVPNVSVDSTIDIHKARGGFKDVIQRVAEAPGIKNSKRAKQLKDRYGV